MKSYDEMARYVLEVRDEHEKKRKRRIYIAKRAIPAAAGAIGALIIGFGAWKGYKRPDSFPSPGTIVDDTTTTAVTTALPQTTEKTVTTLTTALASTTKTAAQTTVSSSTAATASTKTETTANSQASTAPHTTEARTEATTVTTAVQTTATTSPRVTKTTATIPSQPQITTTTSGDMAVGGSGVDTSTTGGSGGGASGEGGGAGNTGGGSSGGEGGYTGKAGGAMPDPWYGLPINQAYSNAFVDGFTKPYRNGYQISPDMIGSSIGSAHMESQDPVEGKIKRRDAEAFYINGCSSENVVAISFMNDGNYYLYHTDDTDIYGMMKQIPPFEQ